MNWKIVYAFIVGVFSWVPLVLWLQPIFEGLPINTFWSLNGIGWEVIYPFVEGQTQLGTTVSFYYFLLLIVAYMAYALVCGLGYVAFVGILRKKEVD